MPCAGPGHRSRSIVARPIMVGWMAPLLLLLLLSDSAVVRVESSSFDKVPDPAFTYTLEVDYSSDAEEEPPLLMKSELVILPTPHSTPPPSPSSMLPDCFVTARAFLRDNDNKYNRNNFNSPSLNLRAFFAADEDEDDDDDDDDSNDDDGSSSMLSNRSLRRSITGSAATIDHVSSNNEALLVRGGGSGGGGNLASRALSSEMSKKLVATALATLVFEATMGHTLEFFKIYMQTSATDTSYFEAFRAITAAKGLAGLYDGFVPWGVVQAVFKGAVFGLAHAAASKVLLPAAADGKLPMTLALTLAGGIGGGLQGYVLSPTLLLKTRVMTNAVFREKMSLLKTTRLSFKIGYDVVRTEGVATLMKGANVFATKRVFDWASRYYFADMFEDLFRVVKGADLSVAEKSIASLLGGVASTCLTLPLDVLVAKTQDAKKAGVKVSAWTMFMDELCEKGAKGLSDAYLRGFAARLLHVCLTTVGTLTPF
jgi:hypothetical protein